MFLHELYAASMLDLFGNLLAGSRSSAFAANTNFLAFPMDFLARGLIVLLSFAVTKSVHGFHRVIGGRQRHFRGRYGALSYLVASAFRVFPNAALAVFPPLS